MLTLREIPPDLWPRNRLAYAGAGALSTAELLAILIGSGGTNASAQQIANNLFTEAGSLVNLARMSTDELQAIPHIGPQKAAILQAALELGRRLDRSPPQELITIRTPQDLANHIMPTLRFLDHEELHVYLLNTKNQLVGSKMLYSGNIDTAVIRIAEVLREPIRRNARAFCLAHNHPSGDPAPSPDDVRVTEMVYTAAKEMDLILMDHLIIGHNRFVSLKERGLGFKN